jgi:predicted polyphosphate/ATP-dependent NAD kinase
MKKLGLIVNPLAGLGGRVGLKGSDGKEIQEKALQLGAKPESPIKTIEALKAIKSDVSFTLITYPRNMGEYEAEQAGCTPKVIGEIKEGKTTFLDTRNAAKELVKEKVDLLLFAGGDGTARDVYEAINSEVPVLGIPTGVKIHSGVFGIDPRSTGELAGSYLSGSCNTRQAEVMDIDEEAFREDRITAKLYGYMMIPYSPNIIQGTKESVVHKEDNVLDAIALDIVESMDHDTVYILGPGTSIKPIADKLGIEKTLLGVDLVIGRKLLVKDVNENQIIKAIMNRPSKIVISLIGGQGFLFGRGNQQISPKIIRKTGKSKIIIVSTPEKLASLRGFPMRVDTGDFDLDTELKGFYRVHTGYGKRTIYRVN